MKTLSIIKYPDPILKKRTKKIKDPLDPEVQKLIVQMIETMRKNGGLGLAAPQVKKSLRLCIIEEEGVTYILINPQIKNFSREKVLMDEGCLSFPGEFFPVKRPEKVKVRYTNEKGEKVKLKASGILSRAIQHEIDHLEGVLVIDRIKNK